MLRKFFLYITVLSAFAFVAMEKSPVLITEKAAENADVLTADESDKKSVIDEIEVAAEENSEDDKNLYSQIELFSYALTTVQAEYAEEPKAKDLIYGSLKGMLSSLDPHSQFLEPDDYKELKTETQGKFGGLGIEISIRDGLLTVITPLEDTPAWNAGIQAGDRIVKIGDDLTKDMTLNDAVKKLRGKPGTDVKITVLREDELKIHDFTITREVIHVQDVKDTQILQDHIGYVRLTEFREDSAKEFAKAIESLKNQGADSLIVDLRNNPGGLLNVAIDITEQFLPEGKLIVSTKGRHPSQNTETRSRNKAAVTWPAVVLINEGSASGSEIFAGALKDNKRAVIVGTQSFGKGSVQSVIPLPDGSGLRLTTSKYFTPSGVSIHGKGITPDIEIKKEFRKKDELAERAQEIEKIFTDIKVKKDGDNETEAPNKEQNSEENPEAKPGENQDEKQEKKDSKNSLRPEINLLEDNQVQSAISVLKGIKVFKGFGG